MKKIILSMVAVAMGVGLFTSCESQLDIEQKGVVDIDSFYQTDDDAEAALVAAYESFMKNVVGRQPDASGPGIYTPNKIIMNMRGDDVYYASGNYGDHEFSGNINEFRDTPEDEVTKYQYTGLYLSVYACNLVLHYYPTPATAVQKRCVAEARVLRAYDYFLLAILWGNPPFVDDLLSADALPYNCDNAENGEKTLTHEELIDWVASECEAAVPDLNERASTSDVDGACVVTKGFANALAGKAYLFNGEWEKAKTALKKVIDSGKYALVPGDQWDSNFHIEGDGNSEKVLEINFEYNSGKSTWSGPIQRSSWMESNAWNWRAGNFKVNPAFSYCGIDGWGGLGVAEWYGDAFYENDGNSYRFDASLIHIDDAVYATKDIKYTDASGLNEMSLEEKKTSDKIGIADLTQGLYGNSFWLQKKALMRKADTGGDVYGNNVRLNNYNIMRYAEVLLNYAEACLQTGDNAEAKKYINMIQERAGSKTVSASVDMNVLKKEKMFEMFLEGCRWFDILRWNDPDGIARCEKAGTGVPHLFDKVFRAPKSDDKDVTWEHGTEAASRFYTVSSQAAKDAGFTVGYMKGKHEVFPYPQTVIDKNPNLTQNPNW